MRRMLMVLAVATVVAALMAPGPVAADLPTHANFCLSEAGMTFDIEIHDIAEDNTNRFRDVVILADYPSGDEATIALGSSPTPNGTTVTAVGGVRWEAGDHGVTVTPTDTGEKTFDEKTLWDVRMQGTMPDGSGPFEVNDRVFRVRWFDAIIGFTREIQGTLVYACGGSAPPPLDQRITANLCVSETAFEFDLTLHDVYAPPGSFVSPSVFIRADFITPATQYIRLELDLSYTGQVVSWDFQSPEVDHFGTNPRPRWPEGGFSLPLPVVTETSPEVWSIPLVGSVPHGSDPFGAGDELEIIDVSTPGAVHYFVDQPQDIPIPACPEEPAVTSTTSAVTSTTSAVTSTTSAVTSTTSSTTSAVTSTTSAVTSTSVAPTSTLPATGVGEALRISAPLGLGLLLAGLIALGGAALIGD